MQECCRTKQNKRTVTNIKHCGSMKADPNRWYVEIQYFKITSILTTKQLGLTGSSAEGMNSAESLLFPSSASLRRSVWFRQESVIFLQRQKNKSIQKHRLSKGRNFLMPIKWKVSSNWQINGDKNWPEYLVFFFSKLFDKQREIPSVSMLDNACAKNISKI